MPRTALHAAWIVRPLHRVHDRVETRSHQVAQMPSPTIFALHACSAYHVDNSTLIGKTQFLFLRSVISTLYCRHLATDAAIRLFSLQTAPSITHHTAIPSQPLTRLGADRFPVFTYALHMAAKLALLIVHGMGDTRPDFYEELLVPLRTRLQSVWDRIAYRPVYYQPVLQRNERAIFERMRPQLRWEGLRELMLFGLSDAASLEHKKELAMSPYWQTQHLILQRLDELFDEIADDTAGEPPQLAIVAQSLGCQVMSNYIWDAQQPLAYAGVWSAPLDDGVPTDSPRDRFRRMRSLRRLLTTGCNIPVFVAGHSTIEPIDRRQLGAGFRWINQFDPDDVLGWPLAQLSAAYAALVEDIEVNASGDTLLGRIKSLTPYSHTQYWSTASVLDRIADALKELLEAG
jgi:hypothetical protein